MSDKRPTAAALRGLWLAAAALPFLAVAVPAAAQDRSKRLDDVVNCRKITDAAARLACYDTAVAELDSAEKAREVVVVDREQVQEAKRSVFGLKLPKIRLFGDGVPDADIDQIDTSVTVIARRGDGRVAFTVTDGARWVQTDDRALVGVKPGTAVTLTKGAMGSYFARFRGAIAIRVERVN
ncbi:hypothetical protein ACFQ1E_14825 [Sphingomonas canadensis]|uniref:Uncharacterized protein n=1 Tax=Sphingomonas canadensis TaxID=1219257 RepID=A0ABW3H7Z2_9SPHN|nr:hypothetical protein [Sphingomonas canadensis]MCW3837141.1 hypothetical protein [Sphingomonas canadensis]